MFSNLDDIQASSEVAEAGQGVLLQMVKCSE